MFTLYSAVMAGLTACPVTIEISSKRGLPHFEMIGLPGNFRREIRAKIISIAALLHIPLRSNVLTIHVFPAPEQADCRALEAAILLGVFCEILDLPLPEKVAICGSVQLSGQITAPRGLPLLWRGLDIQSKTIISPANSYLSACWKTTPLGKSSQPLFQAESIQELLEWASQNTPLNIWQGERGSLKTSQTPMLMNSVFPACFHHWQTGKPVVVRTNSQTDFSHQTNLFQTHFSPDPQLEIERECIRTLSTQLLPEWGSVSPSIKPGDLFDQRQRLGFLSKLTNRPVFWPNLHNVPLSTLYLLQEYLQQPDHPNIFQPQPRPLLLGHLPYCSCSRTGLKKSCICSVAERRQFREKEKLVEQIFQDAICL